MNTKDITGVYPTTNNTFNVDADKWMIKKRMDGRKYLFNSTKEQYVSGLFIVKEYQDEGVYSFDYEGKYYFFQLDDDTAIIQFVNDK